MVSCFFCGKGKELAVQSSDGYRTLQASSHQDPEDDAYCEEDPAPLFFSPQVSEMHDPGTPQRDTQPCAVKPGLII